ncbi:replication initiator protein A [Pseudoalteromonas umbrosa]|uniref:replication initiator protein A n=1 Tax=Pseudoalteromonas umbrosa TaxID=3048489 RepID=UPI0024C3898A|nr:replication initiator protein A [Pseudoalteromonas sp. B95]MDK1290130.1 replication initiator protein A [Pseudoalteromonas sp. B95]
MSLLPTSSVKAPLVPCAPYSENYTTLTKKGHTKSSVAQTNINFLDKPLFIPSRTLVDPITGAKTKLDQCRYYNDGNGFEIQAMVNTDLEAQGFKSFFGLPSFFDKKVLYMLGAHLPVFDVDLATAKELLTADKDGLIRTVEITNIRGFLRSIGTSTCGKQVLHLKEALLRWKNLILSFHNNSLTVSNGKDGEVVRTTVESKRIEVLDRIEFIEARNGKIQSIKVTFNTNFLICNNDKFSRRVSLDVFCSLSRPTAARLYEILSKNFWGTSGRKMCRRTQAPKWSINLTNLVAKMGSKLDRNAKSTITKAIQEINEKDPSMLLRVDFRSGAEGQIVVDFIRYKIT